MLHKPPAPDPTAVISAFPVPAPDASAKAPDSLRLHLQAVKAPGEPPLSAGCTVSRRSVTVPIFCSAPALPAAAALFASAVPQLPHIPEVSPGLRGSEAPELLFPVSMPGQSAMPQKPPHTWAPTASAAPPQRPAVFFLSERLPVFRSSDSPAPAPFPVLPVYGLLPRPASGLPLKCRPAIPEPPQELPTHRQSEIFPTVPGKCWIPHTGSPE